MITKKRKAYIEWLVNDDPMYLHKRYDGTYMWIRIKPSLWFNTIEEAQNWWHFNAHLLGMQYRENVRFIEKENDEWYK